VSGVTALEVAVEAARYEPEKAGDPEEGADASSSAAGKGRVRWRRRPLADAEAPERVTIPVAGIGPGVVRTSETVLEGRGRVDVLFRPRAGGHLVTVTLVNRTEPAASTSAEQVAAMLFQCR